MGHRTIRATFPVPPEKILLGKLKRIGSSPITWGAGLAAITSLILSASLGVGMIISAGILGGAAWFWRKRLPAIEEAIVSELISGSNQGQDENLRRAVSQLQKWDYDSYANQLAEILSLKKRVELAIHSQPPRTSVDENVETLVDTLCNEVSRDLFKMADIRYTLKKKGRRFPDATKREMEENQEELGERVNQAHAALQDAQTQLIKLTGKTLPDEGDNPVLDRTIQRLREEADLASRIRARIDSSFGSQLETAIEEDTSQTTYSTGRMEAQ